MKASLSKDTAKKIGKLKTSRKYLQNIYLAKDWYLGHKECLNSFIQSQIT